MIGIRALMQGTTDNTCKNDDAPVNDWPGYSHKHENQSIRQPFVHSISLKREERLSFVAVKAVQGGVILFGDVWFPNFGGCSSCVEPKWTDPQRGPNNKTKQSNQLSECLEGLMRWYLHQNWLTVSFIHLSLVSDDVDHCVTKYVRNGAVSYNWWHISSQELE